MDYTPPPKKPIDLRQSGKLSPKNATRLVILGIIAVFLIVTALSSFYTINSGTEAVVTRFDRVIATMTTPGLHWKIPFIDEAQIVNMQVVNRLEFGFRSEYPNLTVDEEATMLTGDECLVVADWVVMYQVKNSYNYLYKVENVENTLRIICESAYRRAVASHPLDAILTDQKDVIQQEIKADIQEACDKYEIGLQINAVQLQDAQPPDAVQAAFLDVTSAREEKNSKINQAKRYENERGPAAQGEAAKTINDAEAYKQQRINEAEGSVARYKAIEAEYSNQSDIMRIRLYLEMIEDVLPQVSKIYFVDGKGDTLQFLPLDGSGSTPVIPVPTESVE